METPTQNTNSENQITNNIELLELLNNAKILRIWYIFGIFLLFPLLVAWIYSFVVLAKMNRISMKYQNDLATSRLLLIIGFLLFPIQLIASFILVSDVKLILLKIND